MERWLRSGGGVFLRSIIQVDVMSGLLLVVLDDVLLLGQRGVLLSLGITRMQKHYSVCEVPCLFLVCMSKLYFLCVLKLQKEHKYFCS